MESQTQLRGPDNFRVNSVKQLHLNTSKHSSLSIAEQNININLARCLSKDKQRFHVNETYESFIPSVSLYLDYFGEFKKLRYLMYIF